MDIVIGSWWCWVQLAWRYDGGDNYMRSFVFNVMKTFNSKSKSECGFVSTEIVDVYWFGVLVGDELWVEPFHDIRIVHHLHHASHFHQVVDNFSHGWVDTSLLNIKEHEFFLADLTVDRIVYCFLVFGWVFDQSFLLPLLHWCIIQREDSIVFDGCSVYS